MRNSSERSMIVGALIAMLLILLSLFLFQSAWLKIMQYLLNSSQASSDLPISSTPISGFAFPTSPAAAPIGAESTINHLGITVTRVLLPVDLAKYANFSSIKMDEQYMLVNITVRCLSTATEDCRLTEFDFGVESKSRNTYSAELSSWYDDLKGIFEGGAIKPGNSMSGALVFVIKKGESGLVLVYPNLYAFGNSVKFILTK